MATERQWDPVGPILLTANGSTNGVLQITDTAGFFFGMQCAIKNNTSLQITVYVKMVVDSTTMYVGTTRGGLDHNVDLSAFTTATFSAIEAGAQNKSTVPMEGRLLATYMTDPINAWRTQTVDSYGKPYTNSNPLPVSFEGGVSIANVGIIGPSPDNYRLNVNPDGSLNEVNLAQLIPFEFNEIDLTNSVIGGQTVPTTVLYKQGGSTVATLTLTYDGSANLLTVVRT